MNIQEMFNLGLWIEQFGRSTLSHYQNVNKILTHNSTQPQKQPLEDPLNALDEYLQNTPVQQLSNLQINFLDNLGVKKYIGPYGLDFVRSTINKEVYDPATAVTDFNEAIAKLNDALQRAALIKQLFEGLEWSSKEKDTSTSEQMVVRVEFKNDASITNIVELRDWSSKWHDIARGLTLSSDEAPENVEVIGVSQGSIIAILATTYSVALLLGGIFKIINQRSAEILQIMSSAEDLRKKKLMNDELDKSFNNRSKELKENAVNDTVEEFRKLSSSSNKGNDAEIKKAVKALLEFSEKGGDLDFMSPDASEDEEINEEASALVGEMKNMIEDLRTLKKEVKLLSHENDTDDSDQDLTEDDM